MLQDHSLLLLLYNFVPSVFHCLPMPSEFLEFTKPATPSPPLCLPTSWASSPPPGPWSFCFYNGESGIPNAISTIGFPTLRQKRGAAFTAPLSLSKTPFGAFRQTFAVRRAHALCAIGAQDAHLRPEKYFLPGTEGELSRRDKRSHPGVRPGRK